MRALVIAIAVLGSCGGWGEIECADDGECDGLAVCDERSGHCKDVECISSTTCELGSHCDDVTNTCVGGCADDQDCIAGELCNFEGQCEPYGCRTTELDCRYGENCVSGECTDNPEPHCLPTNTIAAENSCIASDGVLACFDAACDDIYCLLPCVEDVGECPRGMACIAPFLNNLDTYCTGDCPYLLENGF